MENLESGTRWYMVLSSMATSCSETVSELWNLLTENKKTPNVTFLSEVAAILAKAFGTCHNLSRFVHS